MVEISKLRKRLSNVSKNTTEYRMTVKEAKALLEEIDNIREEKARIEEISRRPVNTVVSEPVIVTRVMDGGTF